MSQGSLPKIAISVVALAALAASPGQAEKAEKAEKAQKEAEASYADVVWPQPPDEPRIRLVNVIRGRSDVEAESKLKKILIGASPKTPFDVLEKPFAVEYDPQGRLLVTDWSSGAILRFDLEQGVLDVMGTQGSVRLKQPLGLGVAPDGRILVADVGLQTVVSLDAEGDFHAFYGRPGELLNPTDAAFGPGAKKVYVTDSKAHQVVVFDAATQKKVQAFGQRGEGEGEFNFPTALTFGPDGNLFVVDQINGRVEIFAEDGEYLDTFGSLGIGMGNFTRPKDVAVDELGIVYVTDNAFNNLQLFDPNLDLLTFVGEGGQDPGRFHGASGIAVRGEEFAVVDQLGRRLQIFRFIEPKKEQAAR